MVNRIPIGMDTQWMAEKEPARIPVFRVPRHARHPWSTIPEGLPGTLKLYYQISGRFESTKMSIDHLVRDWTHLSEPLRRSKLVRTSSMVLYGERFYWKHDEVLGRVLEHPHWSLLGYGETDAEAVKMLIERVFVVADALLPADGEVRPPLDTNGKRLRAYLARVVRDRATV